MSDPHSKFSPESASAAPSESVDLRSAPVADSVPTEEYTDAFLAHAAICTSQYDRTCRVLAAEVIRNRAEIARLRALSRTSSAMKLGEPLEVEWAEYDRITRLVGITMDGTHTYAYCDAAGVVVDTSEVVATQLRKLVLVASEGPR